MKETNIMYEVVGGVVNAVDMCSGAVISSSRELPEDAPVKVNGVTVKQKTWKYSDVYADIICSLVLAGNTITDITNMQGMPNYASVCKWKAENANFKERLKNAKKDRAELWHDEIAESLDVDMETTADASREKLKFEKLKYLAEKNNPEEYGSKIQHGGDRDNPIRLVIDTGIRRE